MTDIRVPQQAQTPIIARLPFFIIVRVADSISCLARQRTQYPNTVTSGRLFAGKTTGIKTGHYNSRTAGLSR